jgi:SAM-dependent methyltransferase
MPAPLWSMQPTTRFTSRARDYARNRPGYPAAAIDHVLAGLGPPRSLRAVDVGAGTGISARLLAARGVPVVAVEPNRAMRRAARPHPRVRFRAGTAERTGLPAGACDLVLCAQAFHWFEPQAALAEFTRLLRPSGRLAIVWNLRSAADPFTAAYTRILRRTAGKRLTAAALPAQAPILRRAGFHDVRRAVFPGHQWLDLPGLLGRARSSSYAPPSGRALASMEDALTALHARFSDRRGRVRLVYRTVVYTGTRPG